MDKGQADPAQTASLRVLVEQMIGDRREKAKHCLHQASTQFGPTFAMANVALYAWAQAHIECADQLATLLASAPGETAEQGDQHLEYLAERVVRELWVSTVGMVHSKPLAARTAILRALREAVAPVAPANVVAVPRIPGPAGICWQEKPGEEVLHGHCTLPEGHAGPHQWEGAAPVASGTPPECTCIFAAFTKVHHATTLREDCPVHGSPTPAPEDLR